MTTQSKIVEQLMNDAALDTYGRYQWIGIGMGTTDFADNATNLTAGVTINASGFHKLRETGATGSFVSGRNIIMLFNIEPDEPVVQPVNVGEVGLFKGIDAGTTLGIGGRLNAVQTKDSFVKHRWRVSIRYNRIGE